jgi:predicted DNA-binding ribbon-helix-helix protein
MPRKRSVSINGHSTSFSLEDAFWDEIKRIARERGMSLAALVRHVDEERGMEHNLSSALRLCVLQDLKSKASEAP